MDKGSKRRITLEKEGLPDAVIWNPWAEKAKAMSDFGDDEYKVSRVDGCLCLAILWQHQQSPSLQCQLKLCLQHGKSDKPPASHWVTLRSGIGATNQEFETGGAANAAVIGDTA